MTDSMATRNFDRRLNSRILILVGALTGGGAERQAINLFRYLRARGLDVHVGAGERGGEYLAQLSEEERLYLHMPAEARFPFGARLGVVAAFSGFLRTLRPDIVITNLRDVTINYFIATALPRTMRPRLIAVEQNNTRAKLNRLYRSQLRRGLLTAAAQVALRRADSVVCVSPGLAEQASEDFGVPRNLISVIPNPTDIEEIERRAAERLPWPEGNFVLGVGRLGPQKGFDMLLEAFASRRELDGLNLVILGDGPDRETLLEQGRMLGLAERLRMPGFVTNPWSFMARSRAFILSSRWEGFGNVITEALATGTPVVSFDCPYGPSWILDEGRFGRLVPPGDVPALAEALVKVVTEPPDPASAEARRCRAQEFSLTEVGRKWLQLLIGEVR